MFWEGGVRRREGGREEEEGTQGEKRNNIEKKGKTERKRKMVKCFTDVCAVSVHNVVTTTNELKGKATTRISRDCQLQVVTVYACRQCACGRQ